MATTQAKIYPSAVGTYNSGTGNKLAGLTQITTQRTPYIFFADTIGFPDTVNFNADVSYAAGGQIDVNFNYFNTKQSVESFTTALPVTFIKNYKDLYTGQVITIACPKIAIENGLRLSLAQSGFSVDVNLNNLYMAIDVTLPDITALTIGSTDIYTDNTVSWTAASQEKFEMQVLQDDVLKYSTSGTTTTNAIIPHNTLTEGSAETKVRVGKLAYGTTVWGEWSTITRSMTFSVPDPTLSNVQISQTDIYYPTNITWDSSNQSVYELQIVSAELVVYTASGTTAKIATVPANKFKVGTNKIRIRLGSKTTYSPTVWDTWQETIVTMVNILPTITSLEPNNLAQNKINDLTVSFAAQNYNSFVLYVKQNGITLKTFTGTTQNTFVLLSNTLQKGTVTLELTVTRAINGTTATKISTFTVYSNPDVPVQDLNILFNNSKPTLTWTSTEQTNYELQITDINNAIIETSVGTTAKTFTLITDLLNNTDYFCKIRVKNIYGLWSPWSVKQFSTSYTALEKADFTLYTEGNNTRIELTAPTNVEFLHNEIWRKTDTEEWIRVATGLILVDSVIDFTVADSVLYYYKIRSRSTMGAITDSEVKTISATVQFYNLISVLKPSDSFIMKYEVQSSYDVVNNIISNVYAGNSKPSTEYGLEDYIVASFSFWVDKAELELVKTLVKSRPIVCVKDWQGNQLFGNITSNFNRSYDKTKGGFTVNLTITETDFTAENLLKSNFSEVI